MRGSAVVALACVVWISSGCVVSKPDRNTCMVLGAVAGGVVGGAASQNETDDILAGGAAGAVGGAILGRLLCRAEGPQPPSVRASATPSSGEAPLDVELRAVARDPDGSVRSIAWDLGDGSRGSGATVRHTYRQAGEYTAVATATDDSGLSATATARVRVGGAEVARRIVLRGVNFDFDSSELRPEARVILDAGVDSLRENPGVAIEVAGHTDATGPDAYNQDLSERRARAVADFLAEKGIPRSRLRVAGYGESRPVAGNDTRDGRARNRRVELNVLR